MTSVPRLDRERAVKATLGAGPGFKVNEVAYRYLYYDIGGDARSLQDTYGFCVDRENFLFSLSEILIAAGYPEYAVTDFREHWAVKAPQSKRYCIYPQTSPELDRHYKIAITPAPAQVRQISFVVVPQEWHSKKQPYFAKPPAKSWKNPYKKAKTPGAQAFEWAVTFLVLMNS